MTDKIREQLLKMRELRKPLDDKELIKIAIAEASRLKEPSHIAITKAAFVLGFKTCEERLLAPPTNQERLEKALLIAVEALRKECLCWSDDGIVCEACKSQVAIEAALGEGKCGST